MRSRHLALALMLGCLCIPSQAQTFGVKKRAPRPHEYGNVVMNNFSSEAGMAPVVFQHWAHRSRYTCRLCHVDIGFAMEANATGVHEEDNQAELYCGTCHNGEEAFASFGSKDDGGTAARCKLCHSADSPSSATTDYYDYVKEFPRARFGNKVDWIKAEGLSLIALKDELPGVSMAGEPLEIPKDIDISTDVGTMPDIIFSHEKHAVWNGCELCHPQIFGIGKGAAEYTMQEIFDGKYCGACHGKVSFSNLDCRACHVKDVY